MRFTRFQDSLHEHLRDPEFAAGYVQIALQEGGLSEMLIALREVATAQDGGMKSVAASSQLGRESMYKSLSRDGNPRIKTVESVLNTLGLAMTVTPRAAVTTYPARLGEQPVTYDAGPKPAGPTAKRRKANPKNENPNT